MRVIAIILLLILVTLTQTCLGELLKLPALIEHFYKHKEEDGVSLMEFLKGHYTSKHNDADQSEDERLPFKTITTQYIGFAVLPIVVRTDFSFCFDIRRKLTPPDFYSPQQHLCSIFHPPRV